MSMRDRVIATFNPTRACTIKAFLGVAVLGALADQLTKLVVWSHFDPIVSPVQGMLTVVKAREPIVLMPGFFQLIYSANPGIGWSLLAHHPGMITIFSILIILGMVLWACLLKSEEWGLRLGLGLVLGGAIGNLADRLHLGYVIDFVDLHWHTSYQHPIFNVADILITLGIIYLFVANLMAGRPSTVMAPPAPHETKTQVVI